MLVLAYACPSFLSTGHLRASSDAQSKESRAIKPLPEIID